MKPEEILSFLETGALVVDESTRGKVEVFGPESGLFLHNLSTSDIKGMLVGAGGEVFFGNSRARAVAWGSIYHVLLSQGRDAYWIDLPPGQASSLMGHLDRHLISEQAEFSDKTNGFCQFHLVGNKSRACLESLVGEAIPSLDPWQHMERTLGGRVVAHIRRRDPFGYEGYDLVFQNQHAETVQSLFADEKLLKVDEADLEWARVAAGTPIWGTDVNQDTFISELGRNSLAVCATKGCYLGQEPIVMARDRGQIGKRLSRLSIEGEVGPLPAALKKEGKEVGTLTSIASHPKLGKIGLGYVRRAWWNLGEELSAEMGRVLVQGEALKE